MGNYGLAGSYEAVDHPGGAYQVFVPAPLTEHTPRLSARTERLAAMTTSLLVRRDATRTPAAAARNLLVEALASSAIESVISSTADLLLPEANHAQPQDVLKIARSITAARSETNAQEVHRVMGGGEHPAEAGLFRTVQVRIGGRSVHDATFVPPVAHRVPALMADLAAWEEATPLGGLSMAAVSHSRFETIHPFSDGNGRTGRALIQGALRAEGVTNNSVVPLSAGLYRHRKHYYSALNGHRTGHDDALVDLVVDCAEHSLSITSHLEDELRRLRTEQGSGLASAAARVLEFFLHTPAATRDQIVQATGLGVSTAYRVLGQLENAEILAPGPFQHGAGTWIHWPVIDLIDQAAGLRPRARVFTAPEPHDYLAEAMAMYEGRGQM